MLTIKKSFLTKNQYSRPVRNIDKVKGLVLHWVANPKSSAEANVNFFELRKYGKNGYGSAHFVVGLEGEVLQCIPENEMAYHVGADKYTRYALYKFGEYPNNCTLGIELCHTDWDGAITEETWNSAVSLCQKLCRDYDLNPFQDITLHKSIVGFKDCPRWFVNNPDEFQYFQMKVGEGI